MGERPNWTSGKLADLRTLFPVLQQQINGHPLAYLDNGATTQMPTPVLDAMRDFEQRDRANIHRGVHTLSQRATDDFDAARATLKRFVGAAGPQHELVFTSGTTEALNLVANGLAAPCEQPAVLQPGDEIIVSTLEHHVQTDRKFLKQHSSQDLWAVVQISHILAQCLMHSMHTVQSSIIIFRGGEVYGHKRH